MQVVLCNLRAQLAHYLLHNQFTTSARSSRRQPALPCPWGRRRLPLTPAPLFQRVAAPHPPRGGRTQPKSHGASGMPSTARSLPAASKGARTRCPRGDLWQRQTGARGKAHPAAAQPPFGAASAARSGRSAGAAPAARPGDSSYPPPPSRPRAGIPPPPSYLSPGNRLGWEDGGSGRLPGARGWRAAERGDCLSPSSSAIPPHTGRWGMGVREAARAAAAAGRARAPAGPLALTCHQQPPPPSSQASMGRRRAGTGEGGGLRWRRGLSLLPGFPLRRGLSLRRRRRRGLAAAGCQEEESGERGGGREEEQAAAAQRGEGGAKEVAAAAAPGPETSPSRDSTTRSHERPASGSRRKSLLRRRKGLAGGAARSSALGRHQCPRIGGGEPRARRDARRHVTRLTSPGSE